MAGYNGILLAALSFLSGIFLRGLFDTSVDVSHGEAAHGPSNGASADVSGDANGDTRLPNWVSGTSEDFAREMLKGSKGLTDKTMGVHRFQYIYQPNLARLIQQKMASEDETDKTFLILEYGLGNSKSFAIELSFVRESSLVVAQKLTFSVSRLCPRGWYDQWFAWWFGLRVEASI